MPAKSQNQQIAMSIAEHEPGKLYARNKGLKKMSHEQLHDFASTPRKGLPKSKGYGIGEGKKKVDKVEKKYPDSKYPPKKSTKKK
jgi:hypothetical protein